MFAFTHHWMWCASSRDQLTSTENGGLCLDRIGEKGNILHYYYIILLHHSKENLKILSALSSNSRNFILQKKEKTVIKTHLLVRQLQTRHLHWSFTRWVHKLFMLSIKRLVHSFMCHLLPSRKESGRNYNNNNKKKNSDEHHTWSVFAGALEAISSEKGMV